MCNSTPSAVLSTPLFDVCANRHKGAIASVEANERVQKERDNEIALSIIKRKFRTHSKEVAREMGKNLNTMSGRLSWLKANGYIKERPDLERREGCCVIEWTGK